MTLIAPTLLGVSRSTFGRLVVFLTLHALFLHSCVSYKPRPLTAVPFLERAVSQEQGTVRVTAAALGQRESRELFGVPLANQGIQPLWLEIENHEERPYAFFQQSVDPNYFSPREAAYKNHFSPTKRLLGLGLASLILWPLFFTLPVQYFSARAANKKMNAVFIERNIGNHLIDPGNQVSGFVYTHLDEGTKEVKVRLLGAERERDFTMFVQVPGLRLDHHEIDLAKFYTSNEITDLADKKSLYETLVNLPCCTTNQRGTRNGDPLNLIVIGDFDVLLENFTRAGWDETEVLDAKTALKSTRAFLFDSSYRYMPVSNLYLYGRRQDVAFQKGRISIHQRNHLRLWLSPLRFKEQPVWVGQVSRDIGSRFTLQTWWLSTHEIDPDVDDARDNVVGDLIETQRVARVGYVPGVGEANRDQPRQNLTGDPYFTDGRRGVTQLTDTQVTLGIFDWPRN